MNQIEEDKKQLIKSVKGCGLVYVAEILERAIIPPCKMGDTLYMIVEKRNIHSHVVTRFVKITELKWSNLRRVIEDYGETVFLTRQEAEDAMKKMEKVRK